MIGIEKFWAAVPPQAFTADGTAQGVVSVADSSGFKVKQQIVISATGLPDLNVKIMRFISPTKFYVGPVNPTAGQGLTARVDISAYTVALGAFAYSQEQPKNTIKPEDIIQAIYRQEPGTTIGVEIDDQWGRPIDAVVDSHGVNRLAVDAVIEIESIEIGTVNQGRPNTPANAWPVEVYGPNGNPIQPNSDGSVNVKIEGSSSSTVTQSIFNQISSVPTSSQVNLVTYTVPVGKTGQLERIDVSGTNIAQYDALVNGTTIARKRTYFGGSLNDTFDFTSIVNTTTQGYALVSGDVVLVKVVHIRPDVGDFEGRIQVSENS